MLTLGTKIIYSDRRNNSFLNQKGINISMAENVSDKFTRTAECDSFSKVNFTGYRPSARNKKLIEQICKLIADSAKPSTRGKNARFAIVAHSNPDADAFCSCLLLRRMIKEAFGIDSDVIIKKPVRKQFKHFMEPGEVQVINEQLGAKPTSKDIKRRFKSYDAVFCLDTAQKCLFDKEIYKGIVANALKIVKIDHHEVSLRHSKDYNYGDINLVDTTKQATGQLLMEFVDALGLDKKEKKFRRISDLIAAAIEGDTNFLVRADAKASNDIKKLSRTSIIGNIVRLLQKRTSAEIRAINDIKKNIKVDKANGIVYSTFDATKTALSDDSVQMVTGIAVDDMHAKHKSKYAFLVKRYADGKVSVSIRSAKRGNAYKIAQKFAQKFKGGGSRHSSRVDFDNNVSIEEAVELILAKMTERKEKFIKSS